MDDKYDAQLLETLQSVGLEKYYDSFIARGFNLNSFYKLSVKDFKDLGMNDLQDRQALYKLRTELREKSIAQQRIVTSPLAQYLNSPMPVPQSTKVVKSSGLPSGLSPAPVRSIIPKSPFSSSIQSPTHTSNSVMNSPAFRLNSPLASPPSMSTPAVQSPSIAMVQSPKFTQSPLPLPVSNFQLKNSALTVAVRKRPLNHKELSRGDADHITCQFDNLCFEEEKTNVDLTTKIVAHTFNFDRVYSEIDDNMSIYKECVFPLVNDFLAGSNSIVFAYGQTGSGKTYTMLDSRTGMCNLCANDVFYRIQNSGNPNLNVQVSFYEIYNNHIVDLFNNKVELNLFEDVSGLHIPNLTQIVVDSPSSLADLIARGAAARTVGVTAQNDHSSRSHAIITLTMRNNTDIISSIKFIDLAGSEKAADVKDSGRSTQGEGAGINSSLLAFKECIRALSMKKTRIPFRSSKLTMILRDVFVGNARSTMIATVSPATKSSLDTLNTLNYASTIRSALDSQNSPPAISNSRDSSNDISVLSSTVLTSPVVVSEPITEQAPNDLQILSSAHEEFISGILNSIDYDRSILASAKSNNVSVDQYINSLSESFAAKLNYMSSLKDIIDAYRNSQ